MSIVQANRLSASRCSSLPHLAGRGYRRWGGIECLRRQDPQNRHELLWMIFRGLIDLIGKHVSSGWIAEPAFMATWAGIQHTLYESPPKAGDTVC